MITPSYFNKPDPRTYSIILYGTAVASLAILVFTPSFATKLGMEDGLAENLTALVFIISSISMTIRGARLLSRRGSSLLAASVLFLAVIFFVFAGEEISWGQRIFDLQTGEFMQQHNWQKEVNIHNLHTDIFNIAFHYGALIFLVILPLFRSQVSILLTKCGLDGIRYLIPPLWIAYPSFAFLGMLDPRFLFIIEKPWAALLYTFAFCIGLLLLGHALIQAQRRRDNLATIQLVVSLIIITFGIYASYLQAIDSEPNTISEFKELFVAACLSVYAITWKKF